jgi:gluconate kinase
MSEGISRDDANRWPWLADIKNAIDRSSVSGTNAVIACSALRDTNRCFLAADVPEIRFE